MNLPSTLKLELPLLERDSPPQWNGFTPAGNLGGSDSAPEPTAPQGAYSRDELEVGVELPVPTAPARQPVELLAPAGGPEAAFAAFHFGADAIYLGLKKFSARAEAENFTLEEVDEVTAYAHGLTPRRRVFVTINTVVRQDEVPELVDAVARLDEIGVDAVILQDLGVYHILRRHFPGLELHASTQMAVHNRAGAEALGELGFRRVVLARELTFEEVRDITASSGIETEVFIHGALCYSYSGLCLFSAQTLGRSGNRGKCAYSCRDAFEVTGAPQELRDGSPVLRDPRSGFPFSMKDLALPDHLPALRASGVGCFKIEGRKKSPLYVATTTDYYRKLLDGSLPADQRREHEAAMQTVFSRPWTPLFTLSHKDKEVADRDTVGHRGTPIGRVESVADSPPRLRFRTARRIERHDGLQIDLPILGKPFGFAVDRLWIQRQSRKGRGEEAFAAAAGTLVEVGLPDDHPALPVGAPVYCSSSQAVKQAFRHDRPKPGLYRTRHVVDLELFLTLEDATVTGRIGGEPPIACTASMAGPFSAVKDAVTMAAAAEGAFAKLGQTALCRGRFQLHNESGAFVAVSRLNHLRRELTNKLEEALRERLEKRIKRVIQLCAPVTPAPALEHEFQWSIMVDQVGFLDALESSDLEAACEIVVDIARDGAGLLAEKLNQLALTIGRERIRLALPALTRRWEEAALRHKIAHLVDAGWRKWQAANLSAWKFLQRPHELDLATDWSIYVVNRLAARELVDRGVTRFTLSPEDGLTNVGSLAREFGRRATVIVYQDTPLFLAESCAYANLIGGCPGKANCSFKTMEMVSSHGERVTAIDYHCRTIVLNQSPFCLSSRLSDLFNAGVRSLRADFIFRDYEPTDVRARWRLIRAGKPVPGGQSANFDRGLS
jgi:U32 family peptidase